MLDSKSNYQSLDPPESENAITIKLKPTDIESESIEKVSVKSIEQLPTVINDPEPLS